MAAISRYRIASIEAPLSDLNIYRLEPLEGKVPPFQPGQFVFIHILDEKGATVARKPYSVSSAPSAPFLEFAIDMVHGQLTGRLEKMKAGDVVGVEGPMGHMTYKGQEKAAFIAGGTGIAPFMSMLRHIAEKQVRGSFILFYSTRTRDRIIFSEELESLQKRHPGIKVVVTLTREEPGEWVGECGRINGVMISKYAAVPKEYDWYICGAPELVKNMRICLEAAGVDPKKLMMEGW
ncbi:MAG: FAD-binding oxidoreductase [Candidatus Micrarchaeota archaeon]